MVLALVIAAHTAAIQIGDIVFNPDNGHYYERVDANIDWEHSRLNAGKSYKGLIGHLATITSEEENQFIFEKLGGDKLKGHWIGGYKGPSSQGSVWHWISGERFTFVNFGPGEPNNNGGNEDGLQFHFTGQFVHGKWNDLPKLETGTDRALGYVVEYEAPIPF